MSNNLSTMWTLWNSDHIWNHNEECIQINTNMPRIGSIIWEIGFEFEKIWRFLLHGLLFNMTTKIKQNIVKVFIHTGPERSQLYPQLEYIVNCSPCMRPSLVNPTLYRPRNGCLVPVMTMSSSRSNIILTGRFNLQNILIGWDAT